MSTCSNEFCPLRLHSFFFLFYFICYRNSAVDLAMYIFVNLKCGHCVTRPFKHSYSSLCFMYPAPIQMFCFTIHAFSYSKVIIHLLLLPLIHSHVTVLFIHSLIHRSFSLPFHTFTSSFFVPSFRHTHHPSIQPPLCMFTG